MFAGKLHKLISPGLAFCLGEPDAELAHSCLCLIVTKVFRNGVSAGQT